MSPNDSKNESAKFAIVLELSTKFNRNRTNGSRVIKQTDTPSSRTWMHQFFRSKFSSILFSVSLCSDDSDRGNLHQQPPPQPREFVFSPKLTQSPERSNSPHHSPASNVFPHNGAPCGSYENRSYGIAHGLRENENTYEDTG